MICSSQREGSAGQRHTGPLYDEHHQIRIQLRSLRHGDSQDTRRGRAPIEHSNEDEEDVDAGTGKIEGEFEPLLYR